MKPYKKEKKKKLSVKARQVKIFAKRIYKEIHGMIETVFEGATNCNLILT